MKTESEHPLAVEATLRHWTEADAEATEYELIDSGESSWVVLQHGEDDSAIKIPRSSVDGPSLLRFEAGVLESLEAYDGVVPAPLEVPLYIDLYDDWRPCYLVMSRLPGGVLNLKQADALSDFEQAQLGAAVGEFVAWMDQAISQADYKKILSESSVRVVARHDREYWLRRYMGGVGLHWLTEQGCLSLDEELEDNYLTYRELQDSGRLQPSIIGHDDLGWFNISVETDASGQWRPVGVFDFETVRPSIPERELRYMWLLSEAAGIAAREACETAMNVRLDESLLDFWAQAQCVTNTVHSISRLQPHNGVAELMIRKRQLERISPDRDWSELEHINWHDPNRRRPEVYSNEARPDTFFCREV